MSKQTLATKYRPKTFNDVVEQTPIKMTLQEQLKTDTIKNCYLFTGGAGTGKAQPLYSKVLTPNGFIEMKDVEVGTKVIGCDGEVHNVTATYDRGTRDIYELTFNDNTKVRCCDEHLWNFLNNDYSQYTVELNALFNKPLCHNCVDTNGKSYDVWNYAVPIAKPTKFAEKAVTVPPYVLGFLIQERKIDFENLSNYSIDITNKCIADCDNYSYAFTGFLYNKICEDYSLDITANSENTFIPNDYKINSVENRIELISGMIDGIGFYANTTERDSFVLYTISSQLADDICFIVRSLGGYAEIINSTISCLPGYNVYVKFNDDIKLNLHNKEFYDYKSTNNIYKILENIEYIGKEPCKCIMIDSDEHLYITDGYTVTHNTTDARIFANEINKGIGSPIEMDAASNNSVEDVRKIIEDAKYKSMTGEYKVYIIDECFPANTLVSTENGDKPISEIKIGDKVQSMTGINNVVNVYKNNVPTNRLCCVTINNHKIVTTQDHLFFTQEGWIEARKLKKGDIVYDNKNLQKLWTDFYKKERQNSVLLSSMLSGVYESSLHTKDEENTMCNLWKNYNSTELLQTEDLFSTMQTSTYFKVKYNYYEYRIWNDTEETIFRKNEEEQPFKEYTQYRKDEKNKGIERNTTSMERTTRWKWKIYYSTNDLISSIRRWMDTRICNSNTLQTVRTPVSYLLQSRPRFTDNEISNRGRWERASIEKCTIKRFEENSMFEQFRVESVEIYKRGHNDELFQDSFTSSELHTNYVTMYDLEVENEHCYFVNNILVHNCHSLSNQAWQSLLKLIEEPPAKTVFLFCLEENGLVYTKKGMKKIKDVTTDDFVWTGDEFRPVSNVFNNGIRDCLKITLANGEEIKCTENHKLKVLDGTQEIWKCASDLTTDDVIAVYHSYDECEESVDLTDTECWFLGYLTGNGCCSDTSMKIDIPKHQLSYVYRKLDSCVSEGWLKQYKNVDVADCDLIITDIQLSNETLLEWYNKTGYECRYTGRTTSVPKCTYKMNKKQLICFIQGWYDTEGNIFGKSFLSNKLNSSKLQLACSSSIMLQELQQLLISKGYNCILNKETSDKPYITIDNSFSCSNNSKLKNWFNKLKERIFKNNNFSTQEISQISDLQYNKWYQNIKSIEPYGKCSVYDLEIPVVHEFIYNGVKVHNCTTDPQKIPNTILSRVQRYDFRKISFNGIINRLKYIIEQENKENANIIPTEEGLEYIAKLADGGMRDAITTLDKCISYNSNLTLENVITALGGVNYDTMFNLVDSTYNYDSKNVITMIEDIYNSGANIKQFIKDFSDFVLDLCKYGLINSFDYIRIPTLYSNKLSAYTGEHYGFFNQLLGEMIKLSNLIKWESSPKSTIESTFILLCQKG